MQPVYFVLIGLVLIVVVGVMALLAVRPQPARGPYDESLREQQAEDRRRQADNLTESQREANRREEKYRAQRLQARNMPAWGLLVVALALGLLLWALYGQGTSLQRLESDVGSQGITLSTLNTRLNAVEVPSRPLGTVDQPITRDEVRQVAKDAVHEELVPALNQMWDKLDKRLPPTPAVAVPIPKVESSSLPPVVTTANVRRTEVRPRRRHWRHLVRLPARYRRPPFGYDNARVQVTVGGQRYVGQIPLYPVPRRY